MKWVYAMWSEDVVKDVMDGIKKWPSQHCMPPFKSFPCSLIVSFVNLCLVVVACGAGGWTKDSVQWEGIGTGVVPFGLLLELTYRLFWFLVQLSTYCHLERCISSSAEDIIYGDHDSLLFHPFSRWKLIDGSCQLHTATMWLQLVDDQCLPPETPGTCILEGTVAKWTITSQWMTEFNHMDIEQSTCGQ